MVENNHLLNHKMGMHFFLAQFFEFVMVYSLKCHQIIVSFQKMVEEFLLFRCFQSFLVVSKTYKQYI